MRSSLVAIIVCASLSDLAAGFGKKKRGRRTPPTVVQLAAHVQLPRTGTGVPPKATPDCAAFDACMTRGKGADDCCPADDRRSCSICLIAGCVLRADACSGEAAAGEYCKQCFEVEAMYQRKLNMLADAGRPGMRSKRPPGPPPGALGNGGSGHWGNGGGGPAAPGRQGGWGGWGRKGRKGPRRAPKIPAVPPMEVRDNEM